MSRSSSRVPPFTCTAVFISCISTDTLSTGLISGIAVSDMLWRVTDSVFSWRDCVVQKQYAQQARRQRSSGSQWYKTEVKGRCWQVPTYAGLHSLVSHRAKAWPTRKVRFAKTSHLRGSPRAKTALHRLGREVLPIRSGYAATIWASLSRYTLPALATWIAALGYEGWALCTPT